MNEKLHEQHTLDTQFFQISLEQIEDIRILECLNRCMLKQPGLKCYYFQDDNIPREGIIKSLIIEDKKAVIMDSITNELIKPFSAINIDIGFDFLR